jgi:DnaJ-class molecular chaperone
MQDNNWQDDLIRLEQRKELACRILGIQSMDDLSEIKRAWRILSLKHHPDHNDANDESHQKFILINAAYKCLTHGKDCEKMDSLNSKPQVSQPGKYRLDNAWGYYAWWRENYFDK